MPRQRRQVLELRDNADLVAQPRIAPTRPSPVFDDRPRFVKNPLSNNNRSTVILGGPKWEDLSRKPEWNFNTGTMRFEHAPNRLSDADRQRYVGNYQSYRAEQSKVALAKRARRESTKSKKAREEARSRALASRLDANAEKYIDGKGLGRSLEYYYRNAAECYTTETEYKANARAPRRSNKIKFVIDQDTVKIIVDGGRERTFPILSPTNRKQLRTIRKIMIDQLTKMYRDDWAKNVLCNIVAHNVYEKHSTTADGGEKRYNRVPMTDKRRNSLKVLKQSSITDFVDKYLKYYISELTNSIESVKLDGSGWVFKGNIGFSIDCVPLKVVLVGRYLAIPSSVNRCLLNIRPEADKILTDNRCLQRCLIYALHKDKIPEKVATVARRYDPYWSKPDTHQLSEKCTLKDFESALGLSDNQPFEATEANFKTIEAILGVSIVCYKLEINLDVSDSSTFESFVRVYGDPSNDTAIGLCIVCSGDVNHFTYIKDLGNLMAHITNPTNAKNFNTPRFYECDVCHMAFTVEACLDEHKITYHPETVPIEGKYKLPGSDKTHVYFKDTRFMMWHPVTVYADFEAAITESGQHEPILCAITVVSDIDTVPTQYKIFRKDDFEEMIRFLDSLAHRVMKYVCPAIVPEIVYPNDIESSDHCAFCNCVFAADNLRVDHHAHYSGYFFNGTAREYYPAGRFICQCCNNCNLQLAFKRKRYRLPVYFHNGSGYDFTFLMQILKQYTNPDATTSGPRLNVIPTTESGDRLLMASFGGVQFGDSCKMIQAPLKDMVNEFLGSDITKYKYTETCIRQFLEDRGKAYRPEYIELLTRKEPMFYNLVTSESALDTKQIPKREDCFDQLTNTVMSVSDYKHMELLWREFDIQDWREYYELYNLLDTTLLALFRSVQTIHNGSIRCGSSPLHHDFADVVQSVLEILA